MGRLIAVLLAFYVGTQVVFWLMKQLGRFKWIKPVSPPKSTDKSPSQKGVSWRHGDIEDANFEEVEK